MFGRSRFCNIPAKTPRVTAIRNGPHQAAPESVWVRDMNRILVVEDDTQTADEISAALGDYGFTVDCAATGREGLLKAAADPYDAIVLDRMLPGGIDGLGVLTALRAAGVEAPVLILSALSAVDERVRGLRAGGDDYMTKPFDFLELTARLDILLRRHTGPQRETTLRVGKLEMDLLTHTVRLRGAVIDLLPREFRLLDTSCDTPNRWSRAPCCSRRSGTTTTSSRPTSSTFTSASFGGNSIPKASRPLIDTVRGSGYMLHAPD